MKKNILLRTNLLVCLILAIGFSLTAMLSYRANYNASLQNIEQVSDLTSEGIYYQLAGTFTKPVNISLTMANDSLLRDFLLGEEAHLEDEGYTETIREYLRTYQEKYGYDSVFLASVATERYYNFNGLDRVLEPEDTENKWFYEMLEKDEDYSIVVDNDQVAGAENRITVFVNCKLTGPDGQVLGIVGVGVAISNLQELLQSYETEFGVHAYLVNARGMIEISTEYTGYEAVSLFKQYTFASDIQHEIMDWETAGEAKSLWADNGKGDSYVVTRYIPELMWHLVIERNTGNLVDEMKHQMLQTVIVILAIIFGVLLIITLVIRNYNKQILSLVKAVERQHHTVFEQATNQLFEDIYELDITNNRPANESTERYFESLGAPAGTPYDKALKIIAEKQIKEEYRQGYLDMFSPENVYRAFQEGHESLHYDLMISKHGEKYYWMRITALIIPWESDHSLHMLVYRQNIDVEKQREHQMQELAQTDEMTGMLNKSATRRQIEALLKKEPGRFYAFFIFDIDNFKQANDHYGHVYGDGVITEFTCRIKNHFRLDDILGRIGGDEFVAFAAAHNREWVNEKAEELSKALDFVYTSREREWHVTASIGAISVWGKGSSFELLYQHADEALYQAKKLGRNTYVVYETLSSEGR
ncbi:sensor domain-containing diguanylate cyclase [Lactonifactor longoviformis]|uniref:sensor domain-containing diguanylate cyclase n=1 Tax=unclassified Lactonifactor TaxID=2636670 RepID=UPI0012B1027B|nr:MULTISPECIES: sensor domain-containing diguanylate cyclase [Lactonifactor]MCQ4671520.1 sensor domain-containing diguanylate cyclase [Lactonifactor longoviformis]MSA02659.1 diguanylate cyclase [Lactonifactor sp. BIOML-A5]MSA09025.1 diguanylate cyclase [Lactonifactor sp. BIOML-A4]MSA13382.1 diguanylate cyclase [Lactonifactor sp. BIOML-A3]MSA17955.1 diguanylate cyclase [Lactonifactor sp. BIOML-A2]